jgi:hypothetical protein
MRPFGYVTKTNRWGASMLEYYAALFFLTGAAATVVVYNLDYWWRHRRMTPQQRAESFDKEEREMDIW